MNFKKKKIIRLPTLTNSPQIRGTRSNNTSFDFQPHLQREDSPSSNSVIENLPKRAKVTLASLNNIIDKSPRSLVLKDLKTKGITPKNRSRLFGQFSASKSRKRLSRKISRNSNRNSFVKEVSEKIDMYTASKRVEPFKDKVFPNKEEFIRQYRLNLKLKRKTKLTKKQQLAEKVKKFKIAVNSYQDNFDYTKESAAILNLFIQCVHKKPADIVERIDPTLKIRMLAQFCKTDFISSIEHYFASYAKELLSNYFKTGFVDAHFLINFVVKTNSEKFFHSLQLKDHKIKLIQNQLLSVSEELSELQDQYRKSEQIYR